uniref:Uncharacterized protein LOC100371535 n=1 Tax=Saccoglossus kowalevskii TaxID=10224 RepID=A0ABM0MTN9_SACKO|nr:PREDICTED: uncharacterized protein LOC100371535 [Saccoglossus kowalevskii]
MVPQFSTLSEPIRSLVKIEVPFVWGKRQEDSFMAIKKATCSDIMLGYFDINKQTTLTVDASPVGLGAILRQGNALISCASRALSETESRYSQIEREALTIVWGMEHHRLYLDGSPEFTIETDHKPLIRIFARKELHKMSSRIERWVIKAQRFRFKLIHCSGINNPSDYISRHPSSLNHHSGKRTDEHVSFIRKHTLPCAVTMKEIQIAIQNDKTLMFVIQCLRTNCWHKGHLGTSKTKALMREKVWFSAMDSSVDKTISDCYACQFNIDMKTKEPLKPSQLHTVWSHVATDMYGPLPSGQYLVFVMDEYSRFPEIEITNSTSSSAVIPKLDRIFTSFGYPSNLKSNGPPYNSNEFQFYSKDLGFHLQKITPEFARANGLAENFMTNLGKIFPTQMMKGMKVNRRKSLT